MRARLALVVVLAIASAAMAAPGSIAAPTTGPDLRGDSIAIVRRVSADVPSADAYRPAATAPRSRSVVVAGRVQTCSWSYTPLSGTRCRTRATYPTARLRVTSFLSVVVFVQVWDPRARRWTFGPYRYDPATRTALLDATAGGLPGVPVPRVGVATRQWIDWCSYWLYSRAKGTTCQRGRTALVTVKRTRANSALVRQPGGRYRAYPTYTWRSTGKGYFALDASRLRPPVARPLPPPPPPVPLPTVPSGPPRTGSPATYDFFDFIASASGAERYHSFCSTRLVTVRVDYTGAELAGYPRAAAEAAVTRAMDEAAAASGYPWVMAATVKAPAAGLFAGPAGDGRDNQLIVSFDTEVDPAYDNATVQVFASGGGLYGTLGLGGPYVSVTSGGGRPTKVAYTGLVVLSGEWLAKAGVDQAQSLMIHEFGHAFGLDHVSDTEQVMFPELGALTRYSAGDAAGMAYLRARSAVNC